MLLRIEEAGFLENIQIACRAKGKETADISRQQELYDIALL